MDYELSFHQSTGKTGNNILQQHQDLLFLRQKIGALRWMELTYRPTILHYRTNHVMAFIQNRTDSFRLERVVRWGRTILTSKQLFLFCFVFCCFVFFPSIEQTLFEFSNNTARKRASESMRHQLKWTLENLNSWKWRKKKCICVCSLCWNVKTQRISWKACSASDREAQFTALRHKPAEKHVRWWLCTTIEREREREEEKLQAADQNHTSCNNKHPRDHSDIWTHCESLGAAHKRWGGGRKHHLCIQISLFFFRAESRILISGWVRNHDNCTKSDQSTSKKTLKLILAAAESTTQTHTLSFESDFLNETHKYPQKSIRTKQKVAHKLQPHRIKRRASGNKERKSPNVRLHDQHVHPCWI